MTDGTAFAEDFYDKSEIDTKLTSIGTTIDNLPYAAQIAALTTRVTNTETDVGNKADSAHVHAISDVTDLTSALEDKIGTAQFAAEKQDLITSINGKVEAGHTHVMADITDLDSFDLTLYAKLTDLNGKADTSHHVVQDITDINTIYYNKTEIDGKIAEVAGAHTHVEADITDLDKYTQAQTNLRIQDHAGLKDNPHDVSKHKSVLAMWKIFIHRPFRITSIRRYKTGIMDDVQTLIDSQKVSLGAHASSTNNPHAVTKAQVGLGSVPDIDVKALLDAHSEDNPHNIDLTF